MKRHEVIRGRIGCEIECCHKRTNSTAFKRALKNIYWRYSYDGSVRSSRNTACEIQTSSYPLSKIQKLFEDFNSISKYIAEVNSSCGLHVHISFKLLENYYKLCCYEFVDQFQKMIKKKFIEKDELKRLSNTYCRFYSSRARFINRVKEQTTSNSKTARNFIINFNSFNIYHTIEFRIFPGVKTITKFKKYINMLFENMYSFLAKKDKLFFSYEADLQKKSKDINITEYFDSEEQKNV